MSCAENSHSCRRFAQQSQTIGTQTLCAAPQCGCKFCEYPAQPFDSAGSSGLGVPAPSAQQGAQTHLPGWRRQHAWHPCAGSFWVNSPYPVDKDGNRTGGGGGDAESAVDLQSESATLSR